MRLDKIKAVVNKSGHAILCDTDPALNMVSQWVGDGRAMYPVRGIALTRDIAIAAWGLDPVKWAENWIEPTDRLRETMESAEPVIDELGAPDNVIGRINGWIVVRGPKGRAYLIDDALLTPCRGGRHDLHVLPVEGREIAVVYDGPELAGVVGAAGEEMTVKVLDVAARAARLRARLPEEMTAEELD